MKKPGLIVAIIVVVIALAGSVYLLTQRDSSNSSTEGVTTDTSSSSSSTQSAPTAPILIRYSNSGFTPVKVTVKAGTRITVVNNSSNPLSFNSDPHPEHTGNSELNVGEIGNGDEKTFAVTKVGEWGFHNHLNPDDKGTIVVQ